MLLPLVSVGGRAEPNALRHDPPNALAEEVLVEKGDFETGVEVLVEKGDFETGVEPKGFLGGALDIGG